MSTEQKADEYVGITSVECRGANLIDPLPTPIGISIRLKSDGTTRVGCCYLEAFENTRLKESLFFCTASREVPTTYRIKEDLDRLSNNNSGSHVSDETAKKEWGNFEKAALATTQLCYHKNTI